MNRIEGYCKDCGINKTFQISAEVFEKDSNPGQLLYSTVKTPLESDFKP